MEGGGRRGGVTTQSTADSGYSEESDFAVNPCDRAQIHFAHFAGVLRTVQLCKKAIALHRATTGSHIRFKLQLNKQVISFHITSHDDEALCYTTPGIKTVIFVSQHNWLPCPTAHSCNDVMHSQPANVNNWDVDVEMQQKELF